MKYQFPYIDHIDKVLPAIDDDKNFIVVEKGGYTVINYVVAGNDTFPPVSSVSDAIRRECRGIIFCSSTGRILRRPLHKFFNLGERTETLPEQLNFQEPHQIMMKEDGSMIAPFNLKGQLRWGTKMGVTDVALGCEDWVRDQEEIRKFAAQMIDVGITPIFEWCSPHNQVVIKHREPYMHLLAMRDMMTGQYLEVTKGPLKRWPVPTVYAFKGSITDIAEFVATTRSESDKEGYVLRFADGHMVKVKTDWYCNIHKIKEQINSERAILELWMDGKLDDAIAVLEPEERSRINDFISKLDMRIEQNAEAIGEIYEAAFKMNRKEFALGLANQINPVYKPIVFKMLDIHIPMHSVAMVAADHVRDTLRKSLTNQTRYDNVKNHLFPEVAY
jgi:RNA ligase